MEIINIDLNNIDSEDICCAKSDKCATYKKEFLKDRFKDGLKFKKIKTSGKTFIEYIPSEFAWCPIELKDFYFINCFWISGKEKNKGYGNKLFEEVLKDAKDSHKKGIVLVSSSSKKPFLNDGTFFKKKGFQVADTLLPYFELLYLPLENHVKVPAFKKELNPVISKGFSVYYTNSCPYTEKYIQELQGLPVTIVKINSFQEAQNLPVAFSIYSIFYEGKFITNEILTKSKFEKLIGEYT